MEISYRTNAVLGLCRFCDLPYKDLLQSIYQIVKDTYSETAKQPKWTSVDISDKWKINVQTFKAAKYLCVDTLIAPYIEKPLIDRIYLLSQILYRQFYDVITLGEIKSYLTEEVNRASLIPDRMNKPWRDHRWGACYKIDANNVDLYIYGNTGIHSHHMIAPDIFDYKISMT